MLPIVWQVVDSLLQVLDAVRNSGCTFWDTLNAYDDNEDLIAKQYDAWTVKLCPTHGPLFSYARFSYICLRRPESATRFFV